MQIYTADDFSFLPLEERALAAQQFNIGAEAASHSTENGGSWDIPAFDQSAVDQIFEASIA